MITTADPGHQCFGFRWIQLRHREAFISIPDVWQQARRNEHAGPRSGVRKTPSVTEHFRRGRGSELVEAINCNGQSPMLQRPERVLTRLQSHIETSYDVASAEPDRLGCVFALDGEADGRLVPAFAGQGLAAAHVAYENDDWPFRQEVDRDATEFEIVGETRREFVIYAEGLPPLDTSCSRMVQPALKERPAVYRPGSVAQSRGDPFLVCPLELPEIINRVDLRLIIDQPVIIPAEEDDILGRVAGPSGNHLLTASASGFLRDDVAFLTHDRLPCRTSGSLCQRTATNCAEVPGGSPDQLSGQVSDCHLAFGGAGWVETGCHGLKPRGAWATNRGTEFALEAEEVGAAQPSCLVPKDRAEYKLLGWTL